MRTITMNITRLSILLTLITFAMGCATLSNQGVGVGKNGTVSAYNNLDRHGAIALFQSQEGRVCYNTIKAAIDYTLSDRQPTVVTNADTNAFDAIISQSKAMADLASDSMKYAAHMVAYSNGLTPSDPVVQLAALCKRNNYYDAQIAKSKNRHETYRAITAEIGDVLNTTAPYAALAYVGSKVGDRNNISGSTNAIGDNNGVAEPTIVDPNIVINGENVSTPPLPEDPNTIPEDPNL